MTGRKAGTEQRTLAGGEITVRELAVDYLLERYVAWREECIRVQKAYQRWDDAGGDHRELAYEGYLAALNREEHAASIYARQLGWVARMCA